MRRIDFDYPNTCPKIDKEIDRAKAAIESFIDDLLDQACPLLTYERRKELAADYAANLYGDLEDAFEAVREANEDMRSEANRQIRELADQVSDLEGQVEHLEGQVSELSE
jgi:multidrug resistance efflux pump